MREPLTKREMQVCALIAAGYSDRQIARELILSTKTVTTYTQNIMRKTDSPNRTSAVVNLLIDGHLSATSIRSAKKP